MADAEHEIHIGGPGPDALDPAQCGVSFCSGEFRQAVEVEFPAHHRCRCGLQGTNFRAGKAAAAQCRLVGRFGHDAAMLPGVRAVIVLIGINDIDFAATPPRHGLDCDAPHTQVTANDLINGYKRVIEDAHRRGLRIFGGTLTPAALPPAREALREEVNQWIRHGGGFDGVVDFDAALRDPQRPAQLLPAYNSGDGVHPSDAGYAAMAKAVPLARLRDILSHP